MEAAKVYFTDLRTGTTTNLQQKLKKPVLQILILKINM